MRLVNPRDIILLFLLASLPISVPAQTVEGQVIDESTNVPVAYVNIGIIDTNIGTVSDTSGNFKFNLPNRLPDAKIRFSMIGYKPKLFTADELSGHFNEVRMSPDTIKMEEVIVTQSALEKKRNGAEVASQVVVTGWGKDLKGGERGLRIKVGDDPIFIENLNFHLVNNPYEQVLMRINIRNFVNDTAGESLLNEDILFTLHQESGWVKINLEKYNLNFSDDIIVTLQPVEKVGKCTAKKDYCLVISLGRFKFFSTNWFFGKIASESKWIIKKNWSPGIYLTIYE